MFDRLKGDRKNKKIEFVSLGSISKAHKNGYLTFTIPGEDKPIRVKTRQLEARSERDFTYIGNIPDSLGEVIITGREGVLRGNVSIGTNRYELVSLANDLYAWVTLDLMQTGRCGLEDKPGSSTPVSPKTKGARTGECINPFHILLLYTPAAIAQDPNIQGLMDQCIGTWQAMSGANGLTTGSNYAYWLGRREHNFVETNDVLADRNRFAAEAVGLREQSGADLVVLFTQNSYTTTQGEILEIAQDVGPSANGAFSCLVTVNQAAANLTMVHELGHLLGARHNDCAHTLTDGCDDMGTSNHGYKFIYNTGIFGQYKHRVTTVMHENYTSLEGFDLVGWQRLNRFSDPNSSLGGEATGTQQTHNNKSAIFYGLELARNYRLTGTQLTGEIEGPREGVLSDRDYTWEALHQCATNPAFEWRVSTDGYNYGNVEGTGETFNSPIPVQVFFIWLRITSSNGEVIDRYLEVHGTNGFRKSVSEPSTTLTTLYSPIPNPSVNSTQIDFFLSTDEDILLEIVAETGRHIRLLAEGRYEAGKHSKPIYTGNLPSGIYICRLQAGSVSLTQKLLIQR